MSTLDRAIPLAEVDHVAVIVGENLHLDVPRIVEIPLDIHGRVGEICLPFPPRRLVRTLDLFDRVSDPEPFSAATRRGLDRDRKSDLDCGSEGVGGGPCRLGRARDDRDAGRAHPLARSDLGAHGFDRVGWRADPDKPCLL